MPARSVHALLLLALLTGACGPTEANGPVEGDGSAAESNVPRDPDVVFLVNGIEIRASEVDLLADVVGELFPEYSGSYRRRVALGGTLLPRVALAAKYAEPRREALATCQRRREALRNEPGAEAETLTRVTANFHELGLDMYAYARELVPGEWSEPFEQKGTIFLVRLVTLERGTEPQADSLTLDLVAFPFVPPESNELTVEEAIEDATLTTLDPAWREFVPERYKYRMGGRPDENKGKD